MANNKTGKVIYLRILGAMLILSAAVSWGNVGMSLKKIIDAKKEQPDSVKAIELMEEGKSNIDFMTGIGIFSVAATAFCFRKARQKSRE